MRNADAVIRSARLQPGIAIRCAVGFRFQAVGFQAFTLLLAL